MINIIKKIIKNIMERSMIKTMKRSTIKIMERSMIKIMKSMKMINRLVNMMVSISVANTGNSMKKTTENTRENTKESITESTTENTTESTARSTIKIMENMKENNTKKIAKNWEDGEMMTSDPKSITSWDGLYLESLFFQVAAAALWDASKNTIELYWPTKDRPLLFRAKLLDQFSNSLSKYSMSRHCLSSRLPYNHSSLSSPRQIFHL